MRLVSPRRPAESQSVLVRWMGVTDANSAGYVHGGTVMRYCDEAAGLAGVRHSGSRVVTAAMDRMTFLEPVHVGEVVSFKATVNAAWNTSLEVGVRVEAEPWRGGERRHTTSAYLVMVALDDDGKPAEVPPLTVETEEEQRRQAQARIRRQVRKERLERLGTYGPGPPGTSQDPGRPGTSQDPGPAG
jgi:acyl-CoA hydrolase